MPPKQTGVSIAKTLSKEELTALLQREGWAEKASGDNYPRMKLDGQMLTTPEGGMYVYNPAKPAIPALTVRIVRPPEEYWAIWIDGSVARGISRPDLEGTFSKSYIHPDPDRKVWPSDEVYQELRSTDGLTDDRGNPVKPSWKGDILLQIIPDEGMLTGDEPVYLLTLSTTSLIDFKGTSRAPSEGSVSEDNFITKLSNFAQSAEGVTDPAKAVLDALTSLSLGGVAAEVRILRAENKERGQTWSVVVFDPIHVEPMDDVPAIGDGESDDEAVQ
jgi:hypothetical protein